MTDTKLLALLNDYYTAQRNVASSMLWAMEDFEEGDYHGSWLKLFVWCVAKDEREKLWKRFKHNYPRAMKLKEGFGND